jgi:hypothetical protein
MRVALEFYSFEFIKMCDNSIFISSPFDIVYFVNRGADKSLARPGREQGTATEDFEFHISYL